MSSATTRKKSKALAIIGCYQRRATAQRKYEPVPERRRKLGPILGGHCQIGVPVHHRVKRQPLEQGSEELGTGQLPTGHQCRSQNKVRTLVAVRCSESPCVKAPLTVRR